MMRLGLKSLPRKIIIICIPITFFFLYSEIQYKYINRMFIKYQGHIHYYLQPHINSRKSIENITTGIDKSNISVLPAKNGPRNKTPAEGLKTILFWTPLIYDPLYYLKEKGQKGFINLKCQVNNCFATDDRQLFGDDITKFDAIVFNGQAFKQNDSWKDLPKLRSEQQKYILYETQSAGDYPICSEEFDSFFNWTMTYRLDSDIPCPFIAVKNKTGHIVGPKINMVWRSYVNNSNSSNNPYAMTKKKPIAWYPTDCTRFSAPLMFSYRLKEALALYKMDVDVYGNCGPLVCAKGNKECDYINRDYFFLLVLENSQAVDYVTDKILIALQNNVVPIVYGGADYSRFLPPDSYLDGTKLTPEDIGVSVLTSLNAKVYQTYFQWKDFYSFHKAEQTDHVCSLCSALNDEARVRQRKLYRHFRRWWNPDYVEKCFHYDLNDLLRPKIQIPVKKA